MKLCIPMPGPRTMASITQLTHPHLHLVLHAPFHCYRLASTRSHPDAARMMTFWGHQLWSIHWSRRQNQTQAQTQTPHLTD